MFIIIKLFSKCKLYLPDPDPRVAAVDEVRALPTSSVWVAELPLCLYGEPTVLCVRRRATAEPTSGRWEGSGREYPVDDILAPCSQPRVVKRTRVLFATGSSSLSLYSASALAVFT
jgi:hypothetical protein